MKIEVLLFLGYLTGWIAGFLIYAERCNPLWLLLVPVVLGSIRFAYMVKYHE